jgi:hypothetical protein
MNRTLLLIICDFLLLNLLALTRWDRAEPAPSQQPPVPELKANIAAPPSQDVVELMKLALENERATREQIIAQQAQLETNLEQTRKEAAARQAEAERQRQILSAQQAEIQKQQQTLAALEQQKLQIQQQAAELATAVKVAEAKQALVKEQLEKELKQALAQKEAELEKQQKAIAALEQQRNAAAQQMSNLATAVKVVETERNLLRENVDNLKGEVATVRQEKERLQAQTARLAEGVTQLAAKSSELTQEIRENTPINVNLMFSEFLSNRVDAAISAQSAGLLGPTQRLKQTKTVLVQDGSNYCALLHISDTPFSLIIPAFGMASVSARIAGPPGELARGPLYFWATDPRVVIIPVHPSRATAAGVKTFTMAKNPFKFTEAVLISRGGKYYGEVEFKLDPRTPDYVKMKNRLSTRLFGEFSPSAGDLVLSKTGEFLGIMVNSDYCAVVKNFNAYPSDSFGETTTAETMRPKLEELRARVDKLPMALW